MGVTAGVPVLKRSSALASFLESVEQTNIESVIVADNGYKDDRTEIYNREYPFDLTVLDLEFDIGIGACRYAIAEEFSNDYLLVADCDMEVPKNVSVLVDILENESELGGVSGILQERGRFRSGSRNLFEQPMFGGGTSLVIGIESCPAVEQISGHFVVRFDFLTNAAVIRNECIKDYSWDSNLPDKEHLDFYLGQFHDTEWEFGVCPEVHFIHNKGCNEVYREEYRNNEDRQKKADEIFQEKWGYDKIWSKPRTEWLDTNNTTELDFHSIFRSQIPLKYQILLHDLRLKYFE
ncbi:glycosyltransferase family 2 protein [Haloarcula amylovorans]|uniref:glycosyltransferase family 2 protein n=1 Tax=Haloarcula amylovorans TaxID=2562280 RepID=UPI00107621B9|nr:glycosyltransferase family A protein [Halomicroarcula amylolytica]